MIAFHVVISVASWSQV